MKSAQTPQAVALFLKDGKRTISVNGDTSLYSIKPHGKKFDISFGKNTLDSVLLRDVLPLVVRFEEGRARAAALPHRRFTYTESRPWYDTRKGAKIEGLHVVTYECEIIAVLEHWVRFTVLRVVSDVGGPSAEIKALSEGGSVTTSRPFESCFASRSFKWID